MIYKKQNKKKKKPATATTTSTTMILTKITPSSMHRERFVKPLLCEILVQNDLALQIKQSQLGYGDPKIK